MNYEELITKASSHGLIVKEKNLIAHDGRIKGNKVAIRRTIETQTEKSCILAEELGHYITSSGDIIDQSNDENRKQEQRARLWAYNERIGIAGLIKAYRHGCRNRHEVAEYLDVTEQFLQDAVERYHSKYGTCIEYDNYIVFFEPSLAVMKRLEICD